MEFETRTDNVVLDRDKHTYHYKDKVAQYTVTEVIKNGVINFDTLPAVVKKKIESGSNIHKELEESIKSGNIPRDNERFSALNILFNVEELSTAEMESEKSFVTRVDGVHWLGGTCDIFIKNHCIEYKSVPYNKKYHDDYMMQVSAYMIFLGASNGWLVYTDQYFKVENVLDYFNRFESKLEEYIFNNTLTDTYINAEHVIDDLERESALKKELSVLQEVNKQLVEDIVNQLDCRHRITLTDDNDNARVVLTPRKKDKKFRIIRSFITNE